MKDTALPGADNSWVSPPASDIRTLSNDSWTRIRGGRAKRTMDLLLGVPAFLASLPIILICAAWVRLFSKGAPFYAQVREGFEGRPIRVWKIRTMFVDAEDRLLSHLSEDPETKAEWERSFKLKTDPRVLPYIGDFLRKSSLDELPQLWNVLRGDMSLVGPRPFPLYHLQAFGPEFQQLRRSVPPGVTGLWQVQARGKEDLGIQEELDSLYIQARSLSMDLIILARTVPAVLFVRGAS